MNDAQWKDWIRSDGTRYQQKQLAELIKWYPLSQCREIMKAEAIGDKAYQAARKAATKRR
jgi:hypothetical protein